jgi:serine/threonine protein kinase/alpha-tubulin suppressor-like RCC1 family protein
VTVTISFRSKFYLKKNAINISSPNAAPLSVPSAVLIPFYPGSLACGATVTCGIQSSGKAFCWGKYNTNGQLGTNATTGSIAPAPIAGNGVYKKLSAGANTVCGIQTDLSGWCWGLNDQGQAGAINETQPVGSSLFTPTQIFGNHSWLEISIGSTFGCGINTNRSLYCWGNSYNGALGNGQLNSTVLVPRPIQFGAPSGPSSTVPVNEGAVKWDRVACGFNFACAISTNGLLYCWGSNEFGQTGTGSNASAITVPTLIPINISDNTWVDIFIGSSSNFAFATQSDGSAWSWGDGTEGQLAIATITVSPVPEPLLTSQNWNYIAGGASQVLGVANNAQGYSWGTGNLGQLGAGAEVNVTVGPILIDVPVNTNDGEIPDWSDMCASLEQSCGILGGKLYCWGSSSTELLGSPGGDTSIPREVEGKGLWGVKPFSPPPAPPLPPFPPNPPQNVPKPPSRPPPPPPSSSSGASVGVIVGATVGGVAAVSLVLLGAMVWRRKQRQKRNKFGNNTGSNAKPDAVLLWAAHSQELESPRSSLAALIPPTLAPLEFQWSDVEVVRPLGAGSFGAVYLANINHTKMAVKVLVDADAVVAATALSAHTSKPASTKSGVAGDSSAGSKKDLSSISTRSFAASTVPKAHIEKMLQEASLMATLQHPNVVHLLGFCISPPCMAVEFCPRGSLYDVLAQARTDPESAKRLTWIRRVKMAKDIATGLLHLHTRNPPILHRDVKSPNILVTADMTVKVADMGLSKLAEDAQGGAKVSTMGGGANPRWLAPEVLGGQKASMESDVYAFGVVMWEMLTWQLPFSEENVWVVSSAILRNERPEVPPFDQLPGFEKGVGAAQEVSISKYIELMKRCWAQDPVQRPDMSAVAEELGQILQEQGAALSKKKLASA